MELGEQWRGQVPEKCDLCGDKIDTVFVDGKVNLPSVRSWANLCPTCHEEVGLGLGIGQGQKYEKKDGEKFVLVDGVQHVEG